MAFSMQPRAFLSESSAKLFHWNDQFGFSPSFRSIQFANSQFLGQSLVAQYQKTSCCSPWFWNPRSANKFSVNVQASNSLNKAMRWWEKNLKPNMVEIQSADELVDTLKNAGDRLVVVGFYSPACGGCRALHPKICQLAESYPDANFLKVNHEELHKMCHALHVYVLPFFRFYKGSEGRVCSFSCTVSTIKKLKDALAKHSKELQPGLIGPAKGLDESELLRLASIGEISMIPEPEMALPSSMGKEGTENLFMKTIQNPFPMTMSMAEEPMEAKENNSMLFA